MVNQKIGLTLLYDHLTQIRNSITAYKRHSLLALLDIGQQIANLTTPKSTLDEWFKSTGLEGEIAKLAYRLFRWYENRPSSLQTKLLTSNCLWALSNLKRLPNLKDSVVESLLGYSKVTYSLIKRQLRKFGLYRPKVIEPGLPLCFGDLKLVSSTYNLDLSSLLLLDLSTTDELILYLKRLRLNYQAILPKKYREPSERYSMQEVSKLRKVLECLGYTQALEDITIGYEVLVVDCEIGYLGFTGVVKGKLGKDKWWVEGVYNNRVLRHHYYSHQLLVKVNRSETRLPLEQSS